MGGEWRDDVEVMTSFWDSNSGDLYMKINVTYDFEAISLLSIEYMYSSLKKNGCSTR